MADILNAVKNFPTKLLKACNPNQSTGKILLAINALGMVFAALSNTYAAAADKNTSAEDKKFLVPAGAVTGVANIGLYYTLTTGIIKALENSAEKAIDAMPVADLTKKAEELVKNKIAKAKTPEIKKSIESLYQNADGSIKQAAKDLYTKTSKSAAGVLGAFAGAVIGCAIITPIIRDVSAYFVQKHMEKKNPEMKNKPYKPYFEPTRIESVRYGSRPLTLKNYMAFTHGGNLKV